MKFKKYTDKFNLEYIKELSSKGLTCRMISKFVDIPEKRLAEMLKFHKISGKTRVTHLINDSFFNEINSEIKSYLLGYLIADGCISIEERKSGNFSNRVSLLVSEDDMEVISLYQSYICPTVEIKDIQNDKGAKQRKLQKSLKWTSSPMVNILINKYKILPRKTYDVNFTMPPLPNELKRHFIRGFLDGDGSINKSSISFVGTSEKFLKDILSTFKEEAPDLTYRIYTIEGKTVDYHKLYLNLNKNNCLPLFNFLYKDGNFFLERKKNKFLEYFPKINN